MTPHDPQNPLRLTLGPVLFNWHPEKLRDFYFRMADEADVDTVHVGEVVCSKRSPFFMGHLPAVIERLQAAGKQVVLSSLALIMTDREALLTRELTQTEGLLIEANDISAAAQMGGRPFVAGPLLNIYNEGTLAYLRAMGAVRACLPAELPASVIGLLAAATEMEIEVQGFGRLPLAISARCYHARSRSLSKDGCQYVCAEDPDGMDVDTLDDDPFLAVNGTQTLSYHYLTLLRELADLRDKGVGRLRLWPHDCDMAAVATLFRDVARGAMGATEAADRLALACPGAQFANGYFHGREGHALVLGGD